MTPSSLKSVQVNNSVDSHKGDATEGKNTFGKNRN